MAQTIKNLFKTPGIFKCRHHAHKHFDYQVSPYHVLIAKKCFPSGCVEFLWRCRCFDKGQKCPRSFKHVGRKCFSCKQYHEIKICYVPESVLDDESLRRFTDDFNSHRGWLESMKNKRIRFSGVVDSIKPHLIMIIEPGTKKIIMDGFYMGFETGYLANDHFDDKIYIRISRGLLSRIGIAPGDEVELDAVFADERGSVILRNPRNIDLSRNAGKQYLTPSRALVGRATGAIIAGSVNCCKDCPYCSLIDVKDFGRYKPEYYRRFFCLRGVTDSDNCPVRLESITKPDDMHSDKTRSRKWRF